MTMARAGRVRRPRVSSEPAEQLRSTVVAWLAARTVPARDSTVATATTSYKSLRQIGGRSARVVQSYGGRLGQKLLAEAWQVWYGGAMLCLDLYIKGTYRAPPRPQRGRSIHAAKRYATFWVTRQSFTTKEILFLSQIFRSLSLST